MDLTDDGMCYVCGQNNEQGLRLAFELLASEKKIRTSFMPQKRYQGYADIVHGGIIGMLLDEAMVNLAYKLGFPSVTAQLEIRFKRPARIGELLLIEGEVVRIYKKVIEACAVALTEDGSLVASGTGKLMIISPKRAWKGE